jgi:hypothetical protein
MVRVPEVYSGKMIFINTKALAKDLELMMECTMNGYTKHFLMRVPEVYSI